MRESTGSFSRREAQELRFERSKYERRLDIAFFEQVEPASRPLQLKPNRLEVVIDQIDQIFSVAVRDSPEENTAAISLERNRQRCGMTVNLCEKLCRNRFRRLFRLEPERGGIAVRIQRQAVGVGRDCTARGHETLQPFVCLMCDVFGADRVEQFHVAEFSACKLPFGEETHPIACETQLRVKLVHPAPVRVGRTNQRG